MDDAGLKWINANVVLVVQIVQLLYLFTTPTLPFWKHKNIQFINKEPVAKESVYWNDFTVWDTATRYSRCGQKSYSLIFLVPVRKTISVQEIYSDGLFEF